MPFIVVWPMYWLLTARETSSGLMSEVSGVRPEPYAEAITEPERSVMKMSESMFSAKAVIKVCSLSPCSRVMTYCPSDTLIMLSAAMEETLSALRSSRRCFSSCQLLVENASITRPSRKKLSRMVKEVIFRYFRNSDFCMFIPSLQTCTRRPTPS